MDNNDQGRDVAETVLQEMIARIIEEYPALRKAINEGGPEASEVVKELRGRLIEGLRERGYDMEYDTE